MAFEKIKILVVISLLILSGCGERYYKGEIDKVTVDRVDQQLDEGSRSNAQDPSKTYKEIQGKVVKIADGDTFTLIFENNFEVKVRLNGIDSPEKKQAFSKRAKEALSDLIFGKTVTVQYEDKDRYGRVLGEVFVDDMNVNQEMVRRGFAWHFKKYSDDFVLAKLEEEAKENKVGLWADPNPIPPWEYRKR